MLMGSNRYLCQQVHETSFRSYIRSEAEKLTFVEAELTEESDEQAREAVAHLLEKHADIAGIMIAGGGLEGAAELIGLLDQRNKPVLIGSELTDLTKRQLTLGSIDVILSHPVFAIADKVVDVMVSTSLEETARLQEHHTVPFNVLVVENV